MGDVRTEPSPAPLRQTQGLSAGELTTFRQWCAAGDAEAWDWDVETDVTAGKLEGVVAQTLRDQAAGRSTPL